LRTKSGKKEKIYDVFFQKKSRNPDFGNFAGGQKAVFARFLFITKLLISPINVGK